MPTNRNASLKLDLVEPRPSPKAAKLMRGPWRRMGVKLIEKKDVPRWRPRS